MNADGSGQTLIASGYNLSGPVWSPSANKIVFSSTYVAGGPSDYGYHNLYTIDLGTGAIVHLTHASVADYNPEWSPDGGWIAFDRQTDYRPGDEGPCCPEVFVMKADGTDVTQVTSSYPEDNLAPAWSPDSRQLAYQHIGGELSYAYEGTIYAINLFTYSQRDLGPSGPATFNNEPDWQPIQTAGYPHPASAPEVNVSLVPAFKQCGTSGNPSNGRHAPPLSAASCEPRPGSAVAVVGSASQSFARLTAVAGDNDPTDGNQADVALTASFTDIRTTAGGDYNPNPSGADLTEVTRLRLTDRANGYGGLPGTATEYDFKVPVDCAPTTDPAVGSTCSVDTTASSLVPLLFQERQQAIVQSFRVRVDDAGANGIRGDSDDRIFMTQGVFAP